ncbi:MAG: FG-GAP-like repeat-containing protein [Saprospiraceae bacterium]|nr:FG-GAP-like repeat-containing protein [Saprospiraceae bacterium]
MKKLKLYSLCLTEVLILCFAFTFIYGQQIIFKDVANAVGIDHTYILNNSGGGVSFVDFNLDGQDDITLATGLGEEIQFYENTGGEFQLVDLGINNTEQTKSILWVDIDNDGDKDFYAAAFVGTNRLYENTGDLNFQEITAEAGLPVDTLKSFGAIWGDYNRDGYIDLYYTERPNASSGTSMRNRLFKNLGNNTFEEVTYQTNSHDEGRLPFCAAFFDYNNDKWPDIFIANDRKRRSTLLQNNNGVFEDVSEACNADIEIDGMNAGVADIDNDGLSDVYVTNTPSGSVLLKCSIDEITGQPVFADEAGDRGIGFYGIGWGANFLDINNDGWQDLYVSGMVIGSEAISSELYINDKTGNFYQENNGLVGDTVTSFVNAIGDFDNDGYPDIMVSNSEYYNSQLWSSESGINNWLKLKLQGVRSNRDGIGSKIEIFSGALYQMKQTHCGIAFMGQNSNTEIIGLEQNSIVDSIRITWPTGHIDLIKDIGVNQVLKIIEGQSTNGNITIDSDIAVLTHTDKTEEVQFSISPNPVQSIIHLESQDMDLDHVYQIIDASGKILLSGKAIDRNIDVSSFLPGIYFIQIHNGKHYLGYSKFVKS